MLIHHDPAAAAVVQTREQLDAEILRLRESGLASFIAPTEREQDSRERVALDDQWMFCEGDGAVDLADTAFTPVNVPHYAIYDYGCYRRYINSSALSRLLASSERAYLCFAAVDYEAEIWWNGCVLGAHRGYFSPFRFDVTDSLADMPQGPVRIDIRVRRARDFVSTVYENHGDAHGKGIGTVVGDQMTAGAGIIGEVYLEGVPATHITDVYVAADPSTSVATAWVACFNAGAEPSDIRLVGQVSPRNFDGDNETTVMAEVRGLGPGERRTVQLRLNVSDVRPWTVDAPALYRFRATVSQANSRDIADSQITSFGFRTADRAADGTVMINGSPCYLRGTTTVGCFWKAAWAGDEEEVITQLLRVKALFANTLRVHVHVLPDLFYDCADRVGVMIYQDAPLQWPCFDPVADRLGSETEQVDELIRLVRNHPSVIVYSLTNEMHHPGHGVISDADRRYLESADRRARSVQHGMIVVQDHNGPGHPQCPPTSYHEYHGYMSHTARTEDNVAVPDGSEVGRVVLSEYGGSALASWAAAKDTQRSYGEAGSGLLPAHEGGRWSLFDVKGNFYHAMLTTLQGHVGRLPAWNDYWRASQEQQARVLQWQTGRFRRDRRHYAGAIQHFLQNPAPQLYNSALDLAMIDHLGHLTAGFTSLREAFRPLNIDLVLGVRRAWAGQSIPFALWAYNDYAEPCVDLVVTWEWRSVDDGEVLDGGRETIAVAADEARLVLSGQVRAPKGVSRAILAARADVNGSRWCSREADVEVWPTPEPEAPITVELIGGQDSHGADRTRRRFNVTRAGAAYGRPPATVLVPPDVVIDNEMSRLLWQRASNGDRVVLLERRDPADTQWVRSDISLRPCVRNLAEPEGALTGVVSRASLNEWNTKDGRVIEHAIEAPPDPRLRRHATCGPGLNLAAVLECRVGRGVVVICQLMVWTCMDSEPAAWPVLRHLLTTSAHKEDAPNES